MADGAVNLLYPWTRLMIGLKTSLPQESLHLPRQQKMCASDGISDGKAPC